MMLIAKFLINLVAFLIWETPSLGHDTTVTGIFKTSANICKSKAGNEECRTASNEDLENAQPFGPKFQKVHLELPRINPVRTGYERNLRLMKDRKHKMKTLAIYPPIFEVKHFLTNDECDALIYLAKEKGMTNATATAKHVSISAANAHTSFDQWDQNLDGSLSPSEISEIYEIKHLLLTQKDIEEMYKELDMDMDKNGQISYGELERVTFAKFKSYLEDQSEKLANASVHNIEETKLWHDEDEMLIFDDVFQDYHQRISNLTRIPKKLVQESEPIQVSLFKNGSYCQCSHDSDPFYTDMPCCIYGSSVRCRKCRFISIMYFLNDVEDGGELVFPLADNKTFYWNDLHKDTANACSKSPNVSLSNLVIKPEKGKAIMWYNHFIGRDTGWMSTLDPLSFYGANHVKGADKWIATTWINIVGDGVNDLKPWRMGSNLLSHNNRRKDIIEKMRNDDLIEGEPYLHDPKLIAIDDDDDDEEEVVQKENVEKEDPIKEIEMEEKATQPEIEFDAKKSEKAKEEKNDTTPQDEAGEKDSKLETKKDEKDTANNDLTKKESMNDDMEKKENNSETLKPDLKYKSTNKTAEKKNLTEKVESIQQKSEINETSSKSEKKSKRNRSPENGEGPLGPPSRISYPNDLVNGKMIENRLVTSVLILIEELSRDELEIVARSLHEKLQLACIPLMVNPFGPL